MAEHERIPGKQLDISDLKFSVQRDGTVVLEEATLPEWFSPQQRNEAKADLMRQVTQKMAPTLKEKGIEARFIWKSELEPK